MSHVTKIAGIKITQISALRTAVAELAKTGTKISLLENAVPRAYTAGQMKRADFVISIPDASFDIGLYKQADGSYEAQTDFYNGGVERVLGAQPTKKENAQQAKLGKLFQLYGIAAATEQAVKKGYTVRRQAGKDGEIKLVLGMLA